MQTIKTVIVSNVPLGVSQADLATELKRHFGPNYVKFNNKEPGSAFVTFDHPDVLSKLKNNSVEFNGRYLSFAYPPRVEIRPLEVWVGGLADWWSQEQLSQFGSMLRSILPPHVLRIARVNSKQKGHAFLTFQTPQDAQTACLLTNQQIHGTSLIFDRCWTPPGFLWNLSIFVSLSM